VPDGIDLRAQVATLVPSRATADARLCVRAGSGTRLRRRATASNPGRDGVDELTVPFSDLEILAEEVAAHGADVQVLDPPALRVAVLRLLRGVLTGSATRADRGSTAGAR
jgi:predicted DNA-binding transcriptional regulator YafY